MLVRTRFVWVQIEWGKGHRFDPSELVEVADQRLDAHSPGHCKALGRGLGTVETGAAADNSNGSAAAAAYVAVAAVVAPSIAGVAAYSVVAVAAAAAEVQTVAGCSRSLVRRDVLHERPLRRYRPDRCVYVNFLDRLSLLMAAHRFVVDNFDSADHHQKSSMDDCEWAFGPRNL